ncbi:MAG TPA: penicillin-binding transpeptidase domain-containing protein [Solirubrobacteraceae bacterium]|jgi:penicillin-binding protein 2
MAPQSPLDDRRPAITPQLALRVAMLGGVAFALFAIVFFRLWFLQVLSGEEYVSQARENRVRKVKIEAPRGDIVDRNGTPLVETKEAAVVQLMPNELPDVEREIADTYQQAVSAAERDRLAARERLRALERRERERGKREKTRARTSSALERRQRRELRSQARRARRVAVPPLPPDAVEARRLYQRLSRVIDLPESIIHKRVVQQLALTPYAAVTLKTDVGRGAYNYLLERQTAFPGVRPSKTYIRSYPRKEVGAQLFGTLAEISPQQLKLKRYRGVDAGTRIGQGGIEQTYDQWLRGTDGFTRVSIDAQGRPRDEIEPTVRPPRQGNRVRLTLDSDLERAADRAMQEAIGRSKYAGAVAGAYVALNPETGEVYALGSYPSYDANLFAKPISQEKFDELNSEERGAPLFNRAVKAGYATGSVFKPITALAALASGRLSPGDVYVDTGKFCLGTQCRQNAKGAIYGATDLVKALRVSVDTYFYNLGLRLNDAEGRPLQTWARKLGLGHPTGIDLPDEEAGLVPDSKWRNGGFAKYERCRKKRGLGYQSQAALFACGGIDRPWTAGDNVSMAIGQGDLQVTPLQVAVAYATIANGGKVVRPHLGEAVENGAGALVQELGKGARRRVRIDPSHRAAILEGLRESASAPDGTSSAIFKGFPGTVYGKTGTAQRPPNPDQSWYAAYVNEKNRPIVVVTTIERGGFGAETAAPAACRILSKWYDYNAPCASGTAAQ